MTGGNGYWRYDGLGNFVARQEDDGAKGPILLIFNDGKNFGGIQYPASGARGLECTDSGVWLFTCDETYNEAYDENNNPTLTLTKHEGENHLYHYTTGECVVKDCNETCAYRDIDNLGSEDRGNLEKDGYHWDANTRTLTLKNAQIGAVTLPGGVGVKVVTQGNSSVQEMKIAANEGGYSQRADITFSGSGTLTIETCLSNGTDGASLTVAKGAKAIANGGIDFAASGGVNGTVTVNGTLTVKEDDIRGYAINTGKVVVGSTGTLNISGASGVTVNGMRTDDKSDFAGAFTVKPGGVFTADMNGEVIRVNAGTGTFSDKDVKNIISIPTGYLPGDIKPALSDDKQSISITANGPFAISKDNVPPKPADPNPPADPADPVNPVDPDVPDYPSDKDFRDSFTYPVRTTPTENGAVTVTPKNAGKGKTVTVTVTPGEGYELDDLTVTDSRGNGVRLSDLDDGRYTFTMPDWAVTVTAVFAPLPEEADKPCDGGENCPSRFFTDVGGAGTWYHEAVDYVLRTGLMSGYTSSLFGPDDNLSRAKFAQILYNRAGNPAVTGGSGFTDVLPGQWYTPAITWAARNGIVTGYGDGTFGPNDNITREQFAAILWRCMGSPDAAGKELPFTDAEQASGYALEALYWAAENGVINGYSDGQLNPGGLTTRAQAAQMLMNLLQP